jgi:hypothetical protein
MTARTGFKHVTQSGSSKAVGLAALARRCSRVRADATASERSGML